MAPPVSRRHGVVATVLAVLIIVHGSLWPYQFAFPPGPQGPFDALLNSWTAHPSGLGDILANLLLYMPLGLFAALAAAGNAPSRLALIAAAGAVLSTCMELLQYY